MFGNRVGPTGSRDRGSARHSRAGHDGARLTLLTRIAIRWRASIRSGDVLGGPPHARVVRRSKRATAPPSRHARRATRPRRTRERPRASCAPNQASDGLGARERKEPSSERVPPRSGARCRASTGPMAGEDTEPRGGVPSRSASGQLAPLRCLASRGPRVSSPRAARPRVPARRAESSAASRVHTLLQHHDLLGLFRWAAKRGARPVPQFFLRS